MKKIYFIAEIGINHNGDLEIAKKLIDCAKDAGFDSVKFPKRDINLVYSKSQLGSQRKPMETTTRQQKRVLSSARSSLRRLMHIVRKRYRWFASAWDLNSLNFLDQFKLN